MRSQKFKTNRMLLYFEKTVFESNRQYDTYPKNGKLRDLRLTPVSITVINSIGTITSKILKVIFEPGYKKQ